MDAHHYYQYQVFRHQLNKLQAHKSSFQAWKCVSLGYALFATVLLAAKWHEVSTDLKLLQGVEQILWSQQQQPTPGNSTTFSLSEALALGGASARAPGSRANRSLADLADETDDTLAPDELRSGASLAELLAASNSSDSSANGTSSVLVSHMQISLGRELNGNQLLKQEVEAFLGEFRSAKSTLSLSSLLVFVYIISWILMTLAVNDTRISNDVSLRNILLLSVFGAIDVAASFGFVMVRLIMYNVKNNTFVEQILDSRALREAPLRLSADQLTAFTALRLIGMRSCSAYVDAYVSTLVALLTVLRVYAIVRAIAYYRFLRRFNDLNRSLHHQNQLSAVMMMKHQTGEKQAQWKAAGHLQPNTLQGFVAQNGAGPELMRAPSQQWQRQPQNQPLESNGPATSSTTLRLSPEPTNKRPAEQQPPPRSQQIKLLSPNGKQQQVATLTFGDSTDEADQQLARQQHQMVLNAAIKLDEQQREAAAAAAKSQAQQFELVDLVAQTAESGRQLANNRTLIKVAGVQHLAKQWLPQMAGPNESASSDIELSSRAQFERRSRANTLAPSLLMVNGRPHKLVAAPAANTERDVGSRRRRNLLGYESAGGFESEPVNLVGEQRARSRSREHQMRFLAAANQIRMSTDGQAEQLFEASNNNTRDQINADRTSFTLLSASQLDRLSKKLLAGATGSLALNPTKGRRQQLVERVPVSESPLSAATGSKYKLVGRYRPVERLAELDRQQKRQLFGGANSTSSRLVVQDEDQEEEEEEEEEDFVYAPPRAQRKLVNQQQQQRKGPDGPISDNTSSSNSSSALATDSDEAPTARAATTPEVNPLAGFLSSRGHQRQRRQRRLSKLENGMLSTRAKHTTTGRQRQARASLASLRQTEELDLDPVDIGATRDLLLSKLLDESSPKLRPVCPPLEFIHSTRLVSPKRVTKPSHGP